MNMEIAAKEKRRRLKAYWAELYRVKALRRRIELAHAAKRAAFFVDHGVWPPSPVLPPFPEYPPECVDMTCGAKAKSTGDPCKSAQLYRNGRCKFHGGLSTGPKSAEGKLAALKNLRRGPEPHRAAEKC